MEIKDKSRNVLRVDPVQAETGQPIGEQPKIATAAERQLRELHIQGRHRKLNDARAVRCHVPVWFLLSIGDAVAVMANRKNAGIITETAFVQNVQSPK